VEDRLKNLKRSMDRSVFNNVSFDREKSISKVLNGDQPIKNSNRSKPYFLFKLRLTGLFGILVCAGLLFLTFRMVEHYKISSKESAATKTHSIPQHKLTQPIKHYNPVKDPGNLSKKELEYRMMNTMDYFKTAQGAFTYTQPGIKFSVNYGMEFNGDNYNSYSKEESADIKSTRIEYSNNHQLTDIYPYRKEFKSYNMSYKKGTSISLDQVIEKDGKGPIHTTYNSRSRPATDAFYSLFHWELVTSYLIANQNWEIVNQNNEMFGYKVVEVKGSIKRELPNHHYIISFKMWINRPTGIILKCESYDDTGKVVDSINTTDLKLNMGIDNHISNFKIPSDYKNASIFGQPN
jgi:hypothetical protein